MHENKLKIDLNQGVIEVEGSEQLVRDIYNDFKERLSKPATPIREARSAQEEFPTPKKKTVNKTKSASNTGKVKPKGPASKSGMLLKELDLTGSDGKESLRDFYSKFETSSNLERNLVFVYYLQHIKEVENININHVFTCYRNVPDLKAPGNLKQSLVDAGFKKGWLDTSSMENITVPISGINHLEHDMPKKAVGPS